MREAADLSLLGHWVRRYEAIRLCLPNLSSTENVRWQAALEKAYGECGCTLGAYCFVAAAGLSLVLLVDAIVRGSPDLTSLGSFIAKLILAAVIGGKLTGIVSGRIRVPILLAQLRIRLRHVGDEGSLPRSGVA